MLLRSPGYAAPTLRSRLREWPELARILESETGYLNALDLAEAFPTDEYRQFRAQPPDGEVYPLQPPDVPRLEFLIVRNPTEQSDSGQ
eukprot:641488-Prorocentrum_minimum.AAC.1